eukprot:COSAG01_NODE_20744_length_937_cov_2.698091_2_plen_36_part_01
MHTVAHSFGSQTCPTQNYDSTGIFNKAPHLLRHNKA